MPRVSLSRKTLVGTFRGKLRVILLVLITHLHHLIPQGVPGCRYVTRGQT